MLKTHSRFEKSISSAEIPRSEDFGMHFDLVTPKTRPSPPRPATEPSSSEPPRTMAVPYRQRNSSPFSRGHFRARSSASALAPPNIARAHSMPLPDTVGRGVLPAPAKRPSSPLSSTARHPSPGRRSMEEAYPSYGGQTLPGIGENTTEMTEFSDITTDHKHTHPTPSSPASPISPSTTFGRRHRTSSPLRHLLQASSLPEDDSNPSGPGATASSSSPYLVSAKYNESYPTNYGVLSSFSSTSSQPSTPTSARSRSPSISSLETIPDSPAAEEAALEAERIAELKAAADAADGETSQVPTDARHRSSLDVSGGWVKGGAPSIAWAYGSRDKRKRWSVCGAERRSDLDLETIWED
ncbi:MAG: hypothetical protein M1837_005023 [Sclerophora amabilis]|nr:MAG: hypothetical protein M1837_005023 [Sclerophora amabilis]